MAGKGIVQRARQVLLVVRDHIGVAGVPWGHTAPEHLRRAAWGDPITEERKADLEARMQRWEALTNRRGRIGPFEEVNGDDASLLASGFNMVRLSGADVFWLAMRAYVVLTYQGEDIARDEAFRQAERVFYDPHMRELIQGNTHDLDLRGANLTNARLENAYLPYADMRHTNLARAHLEGADLSSTHLEDTDLRGAFFDDETRLDGTHLNRARLNSIVFGGADIAVAKWNEVQRLGDEVANTAVVKRFKRRGKTIHVVWANTYRDVHGPIGLSPSLSGRKGWSKTPYAFTIAQR